MQFGVHAALGSTDQTAALVAWPPPFRPQAGRRAVRLQILAQAGSNQWRMPAHVDHHRLRHGRLRDEALHHPGEDALVAPPLPTIVEGLRWAILPGRIASPQAIAIDEDNAA